MVLYKRLSKKEVLEVLAVMAADTLPPDKDGDIEARFNDDDEVEIFFIEKVNSLDIN